ncbi:NTP transferase domain-containing protein [Kordiimonas sp.]|uniref:NTP transferase domain-containing protein n=1 Tax=Kordiimonas sp. TaxID=1970157 RepID=UPI003A918676
MRFEERQPIDATGWRLAHSILAGRTRLAKGTKLDADYADLLRKHNVEAVHVFCLDENDILEDVAAHHIATHIKGGNVRLGHAHKGRCNLHAEEDGLLLANDALNSLNQTDEALTVATLPSFSPVYKGQLVATAKVIPYAVTPAQLAAATENQARIEVAPFQPFKARFLVSGQELPDKVRRLTERRINRVKGTLESYLQCAHTTGAVSDALLGMASLDGDIILLMGVSAISDRQDVLPAALVKAGGEVSQLGMPVDPGNLLMLGRLAGKLVLGLPGCARSPALNGLDWVLERFSARLPLDAKVIRGMGVGGLLKETALRPEPRSPRTANKTDIQAIILAAGRSSRSRGTNKLLRTLNGKSVITQTVSTIGAATASPPVVVTGHDHEKVERSLSGHTTSIIHNPDYNDGMASSLRLGLEMVEPHAAFSLICLGDMPFIRADTITALADTAARISEARIFIPTFNRKRGHPVLWHRSLFRELLKITGDKGGRDIIHAYADLVCEVPVSDPGILIDLDTPATMEQFGIEDN